MKKLYMLTLSVMLTGCTLSFSNSCNQGAGSDTIDSTPSNQVTASPDITVPVTAVPSL